ncbi:DUF6314 family protein [Ruegeria faecimaris]|uniref:DUF6314 domain-containing protein n=1 Tax=Ruegeria faecimaris TaxID=686389 RepID=A0A521AKP4_9RHOB|nr:DUF6314 family protein [Ruegeria faecimaris]SMO35377.1 hypothetical protein SAMN06265380_101188 [Ruegeria faecimaris]
MTFPNELTDFEGGWSLSRTIRDARAGQVVLADGSARFTRSKDSLIYDETVTLRIPGQPEMMGTRRYLWHDKGESVAVHFDDGRYFHALKLGQAQAADHHNCPPDSYDAVYDFSGWPCWRVRWTVSGPRKSYEMNTEYMLR